MSVYVYTSIALNYFPKARVLSTTLKKFHPTWKFCLVVSEDVDSNTLEEILSYSDIDEVITHNMLTITDGFDKALTKEEYVQWQFKHTLVEFCTAVKGSALCYLLNKPDCEAAFYFDPDIAIFDNLEQLTSHFDKDSVLLTPHLTDIEKTSSAVWDNEISVLKHGIYNLGFVGIKNDINGRKFAKWWKDRLDLYCYDDIPNGVFTDQSWCDMVPAVFSGVKVLRDPQYNVATWNLTHRHVDGKDLENLYINNDYKLCFYHFSGFDSGAQLNMLNKYALNMPQLFLLRDWYISECKKLDNPKFSLRKWQFSYYHNGTEITKDQRKFYRKDANLANTFVDPFSDITYLAWYNDNISNARAEDNAIKLTQQQLNLLLNSNSWKLTKPLRAFGSFVRQFTG
ncbi:MAG: glycosyl transferase [Burkholderiales bacterium]|jgi:hypothetical protein|nr:glycosyl transferase [Burkholderiales bacterium]